MQREGRCFKIEAEGTSYHLLHPEGGIIREVNGLKEGQFRRRKIWNLVFVNGGGALEE